MSVTTIANRYGRALVDVMSERGQVSEVLADLDRFAALLKEHSQLHNAFASPVIPQARKRTVLKELLARMNPNRTSENFLRLLLEHYRLHRLDIMLAAVRRELDVRAGIVTADVTLAREAGEDEREKLRERLKSATGKEVRMKIKTDPNIIGGVVVRIGSRIYDGSIRNQLSLLRQQLAEAKH